jgi:hypothetical protein
MLEGCTARPAAFWWALHTKDVVCANGDEGSKSGKTFAFDAGLPSSNTLATGWDDA